jgi:hypothetical protein
MWRHEATAASDTGFKRSQGPTGRECDNLSRLDRQAAEQAAECHAGACTKHQRASPEEGFWGPRSFCGDRIDGNFRVEPEGEDAAAARFEVASRLRETDRRHVSAKWKQLRAEALCCRREGRNRLSLLRGIANDGLQTREIECRNCQTLAQAGYAGIPTANQPCARSISLGDECTQATKLTEGWCGRPSVEILALDKYGRAADRVLLDGCVLAIEVHCSSPLIYEHGFGAKYSAVVWIGARPAAHAQAKLRDQSKSTLEQRQGVARHGNSRFQVG